MKRIRLEIFIVLFMFVITSVVLFYKTPFKKELYKIDNIKSNKIMIVAHPDDDMLWGGAHLLEDDYVVVCVTCGVVKRREEEFKKVMAFTNDEYIMLGYPDKTNGKRDNWNKVRKDIIKDLKKIIDSKDWDLIVTHNPDGEYGHEHHKMTSSFVTDLADHSKLYYFGRYYKKYKVPDNLDEIKSESYSKKVNDVFPLYESQSRVINSFKHMWKYENWVDYYSW